MEQKQKMELELQENGLMNQLSTEREEIDELDKMIVHLLGKRMDKAIEIGEFKKKNNMKTCDPCREQEILIKVGKNKYGEEIQDIFYKIMQESKKLQGKD